MRYLAAVHFSGFARRENISDAAGSFLFWRASRRRAIFAAAVADWRTDRPSDSKIKKQPGQTPTLTLTENPDILSTIAHLRSKRPRLVVGFAAETDDIVANARAKLAKKGCDWIVANDVSPATGIMGGDTNTVHLVTASGVEDWPPQSKDDVARSLIERVVTALAENKP